MDYTWSDQARHVGDHLLAVWGLQLCVELIVYVTSLLLVFICLLALIRTIVWAVNDAHAEPVGLETEEAGGGSRAGDAPPLPPLDHPGFVAIPVSTVSDRKQPELSMAYIETEQVVSREDSGFPNLFNKLPGLRDLLSQSARSPSVLSQSALTRSMPCGAVDSWILTANPLPESVVTLDKVKAVTRTTAPPPRRYWKFRLVGPRVPGGKSLQGRGWLEEPVAVHSSQPAGGAAFARSL